MSISKIKEINKKFDELYEKEVGHADVCKSEGYPIKITSCVCGASEIKSFYTQQILSLIEELEGKFPTKQLRKFGFATWNDIEEKKIRGNVYWRIKRKLVK